MDNVRMLPAGEQGLVVEFAAEIDAGVNARVHYTAALISQHMDQKIIEVVPTYRSLLVYFDPESITREKLMNEIGSLMQLAEAGDVKGEKVEVIEIPVCYGGDYGPDIEHVAEHNGLTVDEVIKIHTSKPYLVYMIGFTPGFPYLGGMSDRIATPRLAKPRTNIPAGSVGIAGSQTGFYPIESPGGWQLIGRTPVKGFDKDATNPFPFNPGVYLQFVSISEKEYTSIKRQVEGGTYLPVSRTVDRGGIER